MKKLDKLIINSFIGPFILTFLVVVFILLMQHMLRYFNDIIGKDLGFAVIGRLLFYFAIFMVPVAMPLAVLLSSLITFGNLGEHFELTAIKASGISLLRTLQPIFFFVLLLTGFAFYVNNNLVPKAALEAYSLLYDIKQKKPALELREGTFYNGLPDISIKVDKKFPKDDAALKGVVVYDHRKNDGNREVTKADSGRMYTILNERYLKFELYNGYNYSEGATQEQEMSGQKPQSAETLTRSKFKKTEFVFDLSSFDLQTTDKKWFQGNRIMRNLSELDHDIDSIHDAILQNRLNHYLNRGSFFLFMDKDQPSRFPPDIARFKASRDSLERSKYASKYAKDTVPIPEQAINQSIVDINASKPAIDTPKRPSRHPVHNYKNRPEVQQKLKQTLTRQTDSLKSKVADSIAMTARLAKIDSVFNLAATGDLIQNANNRARQAKSHLENNNTSIQDYLSEQWVFEIQWHKILASSLACVAMFVIGAPLGAIIKKGGLGVPFLVSISFFIVYYILTMQGEKFAKQGVVSAFSGIWAADFILFVIGLMFLRQARADARLFEADFYRVIIDRVRQWLVVRKKYSPKPAS
jgi:lipopolysaccharide export system permease protein